METYQIVNELNIYRILNPQDKRSKEELIRVAKFKVELEKERVEYLDFV